MTQHLLEEQTNQDKQIMRRLITVVGFFMLATVANLTEEDIVALAAYLASLDP